MDSLSALAKKYYGTSEDQFAVLAQICAATAHLKKLFAAEPKKTRPQPTWAKFAPTVGNLCGLRFTTDRMADHYVKLNRDIEAVGFAEIQKRISDGSYGDVRRVANELLKKPGEKPTSPKDVELMKKALGLLKKAMSEMSVASSVQDINAIVGSLTRCTSAIEKSGDDFAAGLSELGLTEVWRRNLNYAFHHSGPDAARSIFSFKAFGDLNLGMRFENGSDFDLPAWMRPGKPITDQNEIKKVFGQWIVDEQKLKELLSAPAAGNTTTNPAGNQPTKPSQNTPNKPSALLLNQKAQTNSSLSSLADRASMSLDEFTVKNWARTHN